MNILAIETSCDETAVSIVKTNKSHTNCELLSHIILSQIDIHKEYGGVFPAMAKREHARVITSLVERTLEEAGLKKTLKNEVLLPKSKSNKILKVLAREEGTGPEILKLVQNIQLPKIDAIAVTSGPGLEPALWVGINTALALSTAWGVPVYPINHMEGHIISGVIEHSSEGGKTSYRIPKKVAFPALAVLISGGHTELVKVDSFGKYKIVGMTRDDAVGEAFDKVARMLGLPYPGGPQISKLAEMARKEGLQVEKENLLPRPMIHSKDLEFSFSGLKTSVLYKIKKYKELDDTTRKLIALDFENAVGEVLVKKILGAVDKYNIKTVIVGGGVSANKHLRSEFASALDGKVALYIPEQKLSTDNALMIALTAMTHLQSGIKPKKKIIANGNWHL